MKTAEELINSINNKSLQLLKKYTALQIEKATLTREMEERITNEKHFLDKINSLEMQAGILKASSGKMDEKDKHDFEKKINQYIKDIEKCITMLNS
ncbi:MAG: hypothetical protein ABI834_04145 [Ginsengibacter sp.]